MFVSPFRPSVRRRRRRADPERRGDRHVKRAKTEEEEKEDAASSEPGRECYVIIRGQQEIPDIEEGREGKETKTERERNDGSELLGVPSRKRVRLIGVLFCWEGKPLKLIRFWGN